MYTRAGDKGETSLYGKRRVPKDSPRVEAYGAIDELNSLLGVIASHTKDKSISSPVREIQRMLFVAGADAATDLDSGQDVPRIGGSETLRLEKMTDDLLGHLPRLRNFIIPGGSQTGAYLQLARAVCRRAERRVLTASREEPVNPDLLPFLNRLSTYLFNLSREANRRSRKKEVTWEGFIRGSRTHS